MSITCEIHQELERTCGFDKSPRFVKYEYKNSRGSQNQ